MGQTTRHILLPTLAALHLAVCVSPRAACAQLASSADQHLGAPQLIPADTDGHFWLVQQSRDAKLVLSANESFFPQLGLRATAAQVNPASGAKNTDPPRLNGGKQLTGITSWGPGRAAEWGVLLRHAGEVEATIQLREAVAAEFTLRLARRQDNHTAANPQETTVQFAPNATSAQVSLSLPPGSTGMQSLQLICTQANPGTEVTRIELAGPGVKEAAVLRKRWRPAAAHTKFSASQAANDIRLWVMEMDAAPGTLPFYSPITTPFGYYGPTWRPDGTVNAGFNFSLWSFGRGKQAPPIEQLSHLLAVGDREASFGGFAHEGTGVKVRNWEPLQGRQGQRQALALRVEPGVPYDTYYSYFYASDEQRWRLFGVGNRYNRGKPLQSLWVGSFVEVPGRPEAQRTGLYPRRMRYRGWVMDVHSKWSVLDQMGVGNIDQKTQLTHTHRGVTDDGWFFLETGGWTFRRANKERQVTLPPARGGRDETPDYLAPSRVPALLTTPSAVDLQLAKASSEANATGVLTVRNVATAATLTLYWGATDALTFADRWAHQRQLPGIAEGANRFTIPDWPSDKPLFVRALLRNSEGQYWSPTTAARP